MRILFAFIKKYFRFNLFFSVIENYSNNQGFVGYTRLVNKNLIFIIIDKFKNIVFLYRYV